MRRSWIVCLLSVCVVSFVYSQNNYVLENRYLSRTLTTSDFLHTTEIINKQIHTKLIPVECDEFVLRFSEGTDKTGTDFILGSKDFQIEESKKYKLKGKEPGNGLQFVLTNKANY